MSPWRRYLSSSSADLRSTSDHEEWELPQSGWTLRRLTVVALSQVAIWLYMTIAT
ncbi:MAG TPA: hypothetical protein VFX15_04360 [Actinomycetes bacterium]|nr:hypothetical protein [Actinomycetes bacterium]